MLRTVGLVRLANPSLQQVGTTTCRRQKLPSTSTHSNPVLLDLNLQGFQSLGQLHGFLGRTQPLVRGWPRIQDFLVQAMANGGRELALHPGHRRGWAYEEDLQEARERGSPLLKPFYMEVYLVDSCSKGKTGIPAQFQKLVSAPFWCSDRTAVWCILMNPHLVLLQVEPSS